MGQSPTVAELAERLKSTPQESGDTPEVAEAYTSASLERPMGGEQDGAPPASVLGGTDRRFDAVANQAAPKPLLGGTG